MISLFVYGTLCFPEIIAALTGKSFQPEQAVLYGYVRKKVKDADYPAIFKNAQSEVNGIIYRNVDERSLKIISFYEGNEYGCETLVVHLNGKPVDAKVFIWDSDISALENADWNQDDFAKISLKTYIEKVVPYAILEFNEL